MPLTSHNTKPRQGWGKTRRRGTCSAREVARQAVRVGVSGGRSEGRTAREREWMRRRETGGKGTSMGYTLIRAIVLQAVRARQKGDCVGVCLKHEGTSQWGSEERQATPYPLPSASGTIPTQGRNEAGARRGEVTHAENFKANLQGAPTPPGSVC